MSRMTRHDWLVYGILRDMQGKPAAEEYRHKRNKHNAKYGIGDSEQGRGWHLVKDLGFDGVLVKKFVPEKMEYSDKKRFEEENWIEAPLSQFDGTGCQFSIWMAFFDIPDGVWVYHRIGMDV